MQFFIEEPKRIVFMGTPDFAVPSLRLLAERSPRGKLWAQGLDIVGVLTRPDKPAGRGRQLAMSPVKQFAAERGISVYQPGSLRKPEALKLLRDLSPDVIVVVAFGQILPKEVLELPPHCCLNVHASLLPRHRGASPIASAILAGDPETGVTIMQMEEGLDTGPIVSQRSIPIRPDDTTGTLGARLAEIGALLLVETLPYWLAEAIECREQDESQATHTRLLTKEDGRLDWSQSAAALDRRVRAVTPWPGAYTTWDRRLVKIQRAHPFDTALALPAAQHTPGQCFLAGDSGTRTLAVACGEGALALDVIQLEGKRAMPVADVLRGHPALVSATFSR